MPSPSKKVLQAFSEKLQEELKPMFVAALAVKSDVVDVAPEPARGSRLSFGIDWGTERVVHLHISQEAIDLLKGSESEKASRKLRTWIGRHVKADKTDDWQVRSDDVK